MNFKRVAGMGILLSVGLSLLTAFMMPVNEESWYTLAGLGMMVFGTWGGILLIKN